MLKSFEELMHAKRDLEAAPVADKGDSDAPSFSAPYNEAELETSGDVGEATRAMSGTSEASTPLPSP